MAKPIPLTFPKAVETFNYHQKSLWRQRVQTCEYIRNPSVEVYKWDADEWEKQIDKFIISYANTLFRVRRLYNELCGFFGAHQFDRVREKMDSMTMTEALIDARPGLMTEVCDCFDGMCSYSPHMERSAQQCFLPKCFKTTI